MKIRWVLTGVLALAACDDGDDSSGAGGAGGADASAGGAGGEGGMGGAGGAGGEGGVRIDGLSAGVEARFDADGMLHLRCSTDTDCLAAQGYFHAAHRFIQMDIRRRFVRGRLSELAGDPTLDTDITNRRFFARRDGSRLEEHILAQVDDYTRAGLEAYSRGVNAWLADMRAGRNGAVLNAEYDFPIINKEVIADWEPLDSAACILALVQSLTDESDTEIALGRIFGTADPAVAQDLYGLWTSSPATILPSDATKAGRLPVMDLRGRLRGLDGLLARAQTPAPLLGERAAGLGSNNWVVGPSKSVDGKALLANDPHLGLSNPSVWYLVTIDAKSNGTGDLHVAGSSFAGLPGVILGHNEAIAWGATTNVYDLSDVYLETLSADGTGVMFNGAVVPFVESQQTIKVQGEADVVETFLYVPHHGPVVSIDREAGTAVTVKWTGHGLEQDLMFPLAMNRAQSVAEARAVVADRITAVGQNWVAIDQAGNFAWFPFDKVPNRPWASTELPSWLPLPGDGTAEWDGVIPEAMLPQANNPPTGYLATANGDMTGALADGDPTNDGRPMLQHFVDEGYRQERILERLAAVEKHDHASMQAIQADQHSLLGERTVPALLALVEGVDLTEGATQVRAALAAWQFNCPTGLQGVDPTGETTTNADEARDSVGCTAFHVLWPRVVLAAFEDDRFETSNPRNNALIRLLTRPETLASDRDYWDDLRTADTVETAGAQVARALDSASTWLRATLGDDPAAWQWGRIHTLTLGADLFSNAGIPDFDHGAFAHGGGIGTVDVAAPRSMFADNFAFRHGASMRFSCRAGDPVVQCTTELPGGNRHHRDSPFYANLLEKWLVNQPTVIPFTAAEVDAATVESVAVKPAL